MLINNAVITGSFIVNGVDVTGITGSSAISSSYLALSSSYVITSASYAQSSASLSIRTSNLEATSSTLVSASSSFAAQSASLSTRLTTDEANIATNTAASASFAAQSSSLSTRLTTDETNFTNLSSSFATTSGSVSSRVTLIEGQYATTGSNIFSGPQYINQASNAISFTSTASLYTNGGLRVSKDSYVSGTAYFNNVVVYGTSSIQYITSSQVNFGTNIITVNTDTPAVRFGGLAVFDSGSTQLTGSMLWDSEKNNWIYSNPSGSTYSGGMIISGPRNTGSLGNEQGTTSCALMMGQGGDHITSSAIFSYGNATCFYGTTVISGSGLVTTNGVNVLNGNQFRIYNVGNGDYGNLTFATATGFTSDKQIQANGKLFIQRASNGADTLVQFKNEAGLDRAYIKFGGTNEELAFYAGSGTTQNLMITATGTSCFYGAIQSCDRVGTCDNQGFYLRGIGDTTHRLYYNTSDGSNVWEYNTTVKFNFYNTASPTTRMLLDTSGNMCVTNVISAGGCMGVRTTSPQDLLEVYGDTNNGINICASNQPRLGFFVGGASANNKIWDFIPQANNTFIARIVNDAKNSAATWLSVTRNGIDISNICFPQTLSTITIMGCVGFGIAANADGQVRLAVDRQLRIEGTSIANTIALGIGGSGEFSIDAPGVGKGRFLVKDNGNVGIGTSSIPNDHILQINNPNFSYARVALTNTATGVASGDGLIFQIENCTAIVKNQENNCLLFGTNGRESDLTITQTGRIGMGTSAPAVNLHIVCASPRVDISTTDSYSTACTLYLAQSGNYATVEHYNYSAGYGMPLILNPSGGPGRGNVGIQTTSPALKLSVLDTGCTITSGDVTFASQAKGIEVYNACSGVTNNVIGYWVSTGPHKAGIASGRTDAASTWEVDLRFYTHPTTIGNLDSTYENMRLYGGGNLTINGTLTQNGGLSDINQKENLVQIVNPLDILSCISGYNFEWKEGSPARRDFMCIVEDAGLIAQEVEAVMPNIVRETKYDCLKTLNYNGITALLVEGMKAQQCTINTLKTCLGIN